MGWMALGRTRRKLACAGALALAALLLSGCGGGGGGQATDAPDAQPVQVDPSGPAAPALQTTWSASMQDYNASAPGVLTPPPRVFQDQTLRQVMRVSVGGQGVRVLMSNLFGQQTLVLSGVHIARHAGGTSIDPATDTPLTFDGQRTVAVPAGAERWSDEVAFELPARSSVAVSVHVDRPTAAATWHAGAFQRGGIVAGNALSAPVLADAEETLSVHWVSRIDVRAAPPGGVVVAFGDSITEGALSTLDANRRYPDALDQRVAGSAQLPGVAIVNAGLGGNRLLQDGFGPRALDRYQRDVLDVTGVRVVLVQLGINDLHAANAGIGPEVGAEELIKGLSELVRRGHAAGVRVFLSTLPPCRGHGYATAATEAQRVALNQWIRAQTLADGVVDFDAALRDPADGTRLHPAYDSGDALHPNDAGMAAMARAVDLAALLAAPPR